MCHKNQEGSHSPKKNGEAAIKRGMDAGQAWGSNGGGIHKAGICRTWLGFYAKSTGMPSKGFKQESNMLAFDLTTLPKDILTAE